MASIDIYFPKQQKWEGGFVNDPTDAGGATKGGVTLSTWKSMGHDEDGDGDIDADDIRLLKPEEIKSVLKQGYWDRWMADTISNQSNAEALVEWVWGSGKWGIIIPQRLLNVTDDGIVGYKTIQALNAQNQLEFHQKLIDAKFKFIDELIATSIAKVTKQKGRALTNKEILTETQKKFENGWKNRINDFKFYI